MFRLFLFSIFIFGLTAPVFSASAWAQFGAPKAEEEDENAVTILDPYDEKYRPNPYAAFEKELPPSPVPPSSYVVDITNAVTGREGDFQITLKTPGTISGCLTTKSPMLSMKKGSKTMKIELTSNVTTADTSQTRYMHYSCPLSANGDIATFILNRDEFLNDDIQTVEISEEDLGPVAIFEIEINQESALIKPRFPQYKEPFLESEVNKSTVWFYPAGTLKLFNPSLNLSEPDTYMKVAALARQNGLNLIEDTNPAFQRLQKTSSKELLVVDTEGLMADKFEDQSAVITLGEIESFEVFTGPNGEYKRAKTKPVFAGLAGSR